MIKKVKCGYIYENFFKKDRKKKEKKNVTDIEKIGSVKTGDNVGIVWQSTYSGSCRLMCVIQALRSMCSIQD